MREPDYSFHEHPASDPMPQRLKLSAIAMRSATAFLRAPLVGQRLEPEDDAALLLLCGSAVVALIVFIVWAMERILQ